MEGNEAMTKTERSKRVSEAMIRHHSRKRHMIETYAAALVKIYHMPSSGTRARNVAAKALKIAART